MRNVIIGVVVAIAVIAAFYFGFLFEESQDGPIENLGEAIQNEAK